MYPEFGEMLSSCPSLYETRLSHPHLSKVEQNDQQFGPTDKEAFCAKASRVKFAR